MSRQEELYNNTNRKSISNSIFTLIFIFILIIIIAAYGACVYFLNNDESILSIGSLLAGYLLVFLIIRNYIQMIIKANPGKSQPVLDKKYLVVGIIINIAGCLCVIFLGAISFLIALIGMYFIFSYIEPIEKESRH